MSEPPQSSLTDAPLRPERAGKGSLGDGVMLGVVVTGLAAAIGGGLWIGGVDGDALVFVLFVALLLGSPFVLAAGIVLTLQERTRQFGVGLLTTTSIGLLVFGGVFVALANGAFE